MNDIYNFSGTETDLPYLKKQHSLDYGNGIIVLNYNHLYYGSLWFKLNGVHCVSNLLPLFISKTKFQLLKKSFNVYQRISQMFIIAICGSCIYS